MKLDGIIARILQVETIALVVIAGHVALDLIRSM